MKRNLLAALKSILMFPIAAVLLGVCETMMVNFILWLIPTPQGFILNLFTESMGGFMAVAFWALGTYALQSRYIGWTAKWAGWLLLGSYTVAAMYSWYSYFGPTTSTGYAIFIKVLVSVVAIGGLIVGMFRGWEIRDEKDELATIQYA